MPKAGPGSLPDPEVQAGFPRGVRLLTKQDYGRVFDVARPFGGPDVTILARSNRKGRARLGLVIGKKKIRRSVDRNLIKRLVRESFRRYQTDLPDVDLVVIAKPHKKIDRIRIAANLERQWQRIIRSYDAPARKNDPL